MFFYLAKLLGFFALPSNLLIALGCLGAALLATRFARAGRRLAAAAALALALCGFSPLGNLLLIPLEERFPPWQERGSAPDGIVVLGGGIDELVSAARGTVALGEAAERMTAAVRLARRYPQARLVFAGGSGRLFGGVDEAAFARRFWEEMGIAPARIRTDARSRNTGENAAFARSIAEPRAGERWLLVTSAFHMPRAVGVFRRAGFPVEAYPVDWRTRGEADALRGFARAAEGLARTDQALREWVGLAAYRLAGKSDALFPRP